MCAKSFQEPDLIGTPRTEIHDGRIWVDGCWDFFHHGHARAMLQARQLGTELYVGIHSDESILENKGPAVMTQDERIAAVNACKWVSRSIPNAPYVTSLPLISQYGCKYVVHGDDITSDSNGEDCYRYVKAAGRFKVVKRTPSISTTDLVGRMLLCTRTHFMNSLYQVLVDGEKEIPESKGEQKINSASLRNLIQEYATDKTGLKPGSTVWYWISQYDKNNSNNSDSTEDKGIFTPVTEVIAPKPGQRVVYVDGGFDLFSSGHIEFLRLVIQAEERIGRETGWYSNEAAHQRISRGNDYGPAFVIAGVHDDRVINHWKGLNYPIMNILERGLCVLQCKYVDSVVLGAPFKPSLAYLTSMPGYIPKAVYHGPTSFAPLTLDPYLIPKKMGIYHEIGHHAFSEVNATQIVQRILKSRDLYEERQRLKHIKSINEGAASEEGNPNDNQAKQKSVNR